MKITIKSFKSKLQGVKASLSVGIEGLVWINGISIREGKNGDFVSYPSYKQGEEYKSYIMAKKEFTQAILNNYEIDKTVSCNVHLKSEDDLKDEAEEEFPF